MPNNTCSSAFECTAVNSVLAIGGVGGLAVGLAGREILENLFTGLIILSSSPFEVGDEVLFTPPTGNVSTYSGATIALGCLLSACSHDSAHQRAFLDIPSCLLVLDRQLFCCFASIVPS